MFRTVWAALAIAVRMASSTLVGLLPTISLNLYTWSLTGPPRRRSAEPWHGRRSAVTYSGAATYVVPAAPNTSDNGRQPTRFLESSSTSRTDAEGAPDDRRSRLRRPRQPGRPRPRAPPRAGRRRRRDVAGDGAAPHRPAALDGARGPAQRRRRRRGRPAHLGPAPAQRRPDRGPARPARLAGDDGPPGGARGAALAAARRPERGRRRPHRARRPRPRHRPDEPRTAPRTAPRRRHVAGDAAPDRVGTAARAGFLRRAQRGAGHPAGQPRPPARPGGAGA